MNSHFFQSPFNDEISKMQDMGLLQKMLDDGRYKAYGRAGMLQIQESVVRENAKLKLAQECIGI